MGGKPRRNGVTDLGSLSRRIKRPPDQMLLRGAEEWTWQVALISQGWWDLSEILMAENEKTLQAKETQSEKKGPTKNEPCLGNEGERGEVFGISSSRNSYYTL